MPRMQATAFRVPVQAPRESTDDGGVAPNDECCVGHVRARERGLREFRETVRVASVGGLKSPREAAALKGEGGRARPSRAKRRRGDARAPEADATDHTAD